MLPVSVILLAVFAVAAVCIAVTVRRLLPGAKRFIAMGIAVGERAPRNAAQREAVADLADTEDVAKLGTLIDGAFADGNTGGRARRAIARLLPRLDAESAAALAAHHKDLLRWLVAAYATTMRGGPGVAGTAVRNLVGADRIRQTLWREPESAVLLEGVVRCMRWIGDEGTERHLAAMAAMPAEKPEEARIRAAAEDALPPLRERLVRQRDADRLLRPAAPAPGEGLLRPAQAAPDAPPETLLRPAAAEDPVPAEAVVADEALEQHIR